MRTATETPLCWVPSCAHTCFSLFFSPGRGANNAVIRLVISKASSFRRHVDLRELLRTQNWFVSQSRSCFAKRSQAHGPRPRTDEAAECSS